MKTAELKEYLGMVVQMEKDVNLQEELCRQLENKKQSSKAEIDRLTNLINTAVAKVNKPVEPQMAMPKKENEHRKKAKDSIIVGPVVLAGTAISFVGLIVSDMAGWDIVLLFAIALLIGMFETIPCLLASLIALIGYPGEAKKDEEDYERALEKYEATQREYKTKKEEYEKATKIVQQENVKRSKQIEKIKTEIQVTEAYSNEVAMEICSSRERLEEMYAYNIIFPKYRNYVMVCSIYEYLAAGRCVTLEGHEGAYNILELEIRLNRIITQLDDVLRNLAAIQQNQYMLYSCLKETNYKIDALLDEESRIADNLEGLQNQMENHAEMIDTRIAELQKSSELSNYLAECNQRELHYMNRMNYLAGHYDNPYGNYAPV